MSKSEKNTERVFLTESYTEFVKQIGGAIITINPSSRLYIDPLEIGADMDLSSIKCCCLGTL